MPKRRLYCFVIRQNYFFMGSGYLLTYLTLLTYLLTPWRRVLLAKLTGSVASQEIPRIFGTRKFFPVLTSARHLSLTWTNSIQSPQPPPTSWRSILILSSHLTCSAYDVRLQFYQDVTIYNLLKSGCLFICKIKKKTWVVVRFWVLQINKQPLFTRL
jgi:hypothetical protein